MRIAVFCGSSRRAPERDLRTAGALGREIARRDHVLIYGGGRTGLMGAVADGARAAGGRVRAVVLREVLEEEVHAVDFEELYRVDDARARKAGLDERADGFVALPGGLGTLEELTEILSFRKLGLHQRPVVLLDAGGFYAPLLEQIERAVAGRFEGPEVRDYLSVAADPSEAVRLIERAAPA